MAPEMEQDFKCFNVFSLEKCVIKSSKEYFIKSYVTGSGIVPNEEFVFTPCYHEDLVIANSVCATEQHDQCLTVPVQVMNLGSEDVVLKKGTFLGHVEPLKQSGNVFQVQEEEVKTKIENKFNIGENNYSAKEKKDFMNVLKEYRHVFSSFKGEVGHLKGVQHRI